MPQNLTIEEANVLSAALDAIEQYCGEAEHLCSEAERMVAEVDDQAVDGTRMQSIEQQFNTPSA